MPNIYKELTEKYPFISYIKYADREFVGIILNKDATIVSIYDYDMLPSLEVKQKFLELGDIWWWESNRLFPINIFLKEEFVGFKPYIKTFMAKDVEIVHGPYVSMNELAQRRTKRRNIQLVQKIK
jgi:hypothetical protein